MSRGNDFWDAALSSVVTGRCTQCGGTATYSGTDSIKLNKALREFYAIHQTCQGKPERRVTKCTREWGHEGPCNGMPCNWVLSKTPKEVVKIPRPPKSTRRTKLFESLFGDRK
jgi:hypothetical protein